MSRVGLSIIICTFNRAPFLSDLLASIARGQCDRLDLEVLVIDNNCTDNTAEIVRSFEGRIPSLRHIVERRQGLSFARNCGAAAASKPNLLYLDDETSLTEAYLDRLEVILRVFSPDLFGGPSIPRFDRPRPAWFDVADETRQYAAQSGFSQTATISGANFGIRRAVLDRIGMFDTALGMRGTVMAFGEDRDMVERYRAQTPLEEQRVYYAVELVVSNYIMPYKLDREYQLARALENAAMKPVVLFQSGRKGRLELIANAIHFVWLDLLWSMKIFVLYGRDPVARYKVLRRLYIVAGRLQGLGRVVRLSVTKSARSEPIISIRPEKRIL
jgi:glycosyltransferase involved in cell wall biosynthesis